LHCAIEVAGNAGHIPFPIKAPDGGLSSGPHSVRRRMPPLKVKADTLFQFRAPPVALSAMTKPRHAPQSAPQLRTGGGIPLTRTPSLAWIANSRWTMNGGYIDERGRVKKIAACNCNIPTLRELCASHHLAGG
jgi:hypothetical protein